MADATKINSKNGIVSFSANDLIDHDLMRWVRSRSHGINHSCTVNDVPFERVAAKVFVTRYPDTMIKMATKVIVKDKDCVDVYLKLADRVAENMYEKYPTKLVYTNSSKKESK